MSPKPPPRRGRPQGPPPRQGGPLRNQGRQQLRAQGRPQQRNPGLGGDLVEGRHAVRELLRAGTRPVKDVWVAEDVDAAPILDEIAGLAARANIPVRRVPRSRLEGEARTEAPQGVLAHAAPVAEHDIEDLIGRRAASKQPPFLVAVDGVTDPANLGAILRTAACAGVTGIVLPRHRAAHLTPSAVKAAAGAVEHLPMAVVAGLPAALLALKEAGVWVVGLDAGGPPIWGIATATEPVCLVLGAEGRGLGRLVRERCDVVVGIPQVGPLDSLNVGAAAAVACFEVARLRSGHGPE